MHILREALSDLGNVDEAKLRHLTKTGDTPDTVLAALLSIFDRYDGIADCHWLYDFSGEAFDRVFELVADASGEDEDEVKAMLYRAVISYASEKLDEIYTVYGEDIPDLQQQPIWDWPVINLPDSAGSGGKGGDYLPFSALKLFGYTVGKTNGWPEKKRQTFLYDFMTKQLPPIVHEIFGDEYGSPMSTTRLRKMANVIASNCGNFIRNDAHRYRYAISDWTADLDYLREIFYEGHGLKFEPWPEPDN